MIPLVVRSHYSLGWGTASPERLVAAARRRGYTHLALTDTDNLYGHWAFRRACAEEGVAPIIGAEVTDPKTAWRAVCLVEDDEGYKNLCRLLTRRHCDPSFELQAALPEFQRGLVVLTASAALLTAWHEAGVTALAAALPRSPNQAASQAREAARRLGLPAAAVPSSFLLDPEEYPLHRLLRAIDRNTSLSRLGPGDVAPHDAWLAPPEEYGRRFAVWPETLAAGDALAERCTFRGTRPGLVMPPWSDDAGRSAAEVLRERAYAGAKVRYGAELPGAVVERLDYELAVIDRMKFSPYFLTVERIVKRSPRICGRGSGAASIVAYALAITNVCPIRNNLYFERFLNSGRTDPPDIDVDFAWDERDALIESVLEEYQGHAAMVAVHQCYQFRGAVRETAKVYGLADGEIKQVTRRLPYFQQAAEDSEGDEDLRGRLASVPQLHDLDYPDPWPEILRLATRLVGVPRQLSVHPGGIVITPGPIDEYVPVEIAPKGVPILQWEKDGTEDSGLVKIDLLGNRSLGVVRDTVANIRRNGQYFDENRWNPEDDPATQARIARGETMGCFYIESPATRLLQQKAQIGDYHHVVIHTSIIRPAAHMWINEYLRRLHGGSWEPIHPLLADVLDETYGIMVYQEDVSKTAVALAGFSDADADGLRKAMSRKDREQRLRDYFRRFSEGAQARGVSNAQIQQVWEMILSFEGYSFCRPHSSSYARVSFQAAWLKQHYPAEFMAAVVSNQGGFYSPFAYVSEARRQGCRILPPDVNESEVRWQGSDRDLRVGWLSLKGLSVETAERIVTERQRRPYSTIGDFLVRVRPSEDEVRVLIHARSFESLHPEESQAALRWAWYTHKASHRTKGSAGPELDLSLSQHAPKIPSPPFAAEAPIVLLRREFSALGFLCDQHPMVLFAETLGKDIVKARDLPGFVGHPVRVAGFLITGKVVPTRAGEPMEFVTFEDETGVVETVFFPEAYRRFCDVLEYRRPYLLDGQVEEDYGAITLTVTRATLIRPLPSSC